MSLEKTINSLKTTRKDTEVINEIMTEIKESSLDTDKKLTLLTLLLELTRVLQEKDQKHYEKIQDLLDQVKKLTFSK